MGQRNLSLRDVVLLNVVAVSSLRWIASAADAGPSSLSLWALAALLFFVPQAISVAALSLRYPGEGGLYRWTKAAFGEKHGFLCGWCYWVNNLLYFPALLLYVSGNIAFALHAANPDWDLEHNRTFLTLVTLGGLWLVAALSILGVRFGRWLQNTGALANWGPVAIILLLASLSVWKFGPANPISLQTTLPRFGDFSQTSYFAQLCFALAGLELLSFFGGSIDRPRTVIPIALAISGVFVLSVYVLGTLGVLVSVPQSQITLVNGVLLPIQHVGERFGVGWIAALCAGLITIAGLGSVLAWFSGAARVPYLVGVDRYLPPSFGRLHPKYGTPVNAILIQTAVATVLTFFASVGSKQFETTYRILVDMCLILYFIPYCYLFLSTAKLAHEGRRVTVWSSYVGFLVTAFAIVTTTLPNGAEIDGLSLAKTIGGATAMLGLGVWLFARMDSRVRSQLAT